MIRKTAMVLMLGASVALTGCEEDDEGILEPEFAVTTQDFNRFDSDNDAVLTEGEFGTGFRQENVFDTFDENRDAFIDTNEFNNNLNNLGDFNTFDEDRDTRLSEDEFLGGTFNTFDTNTDLGVDENEFDIGLDLF